MSTFNWFERDIAIGVAGEIADTTVKNIDSFHVGQTAGLEPADLVIRDTVEGTVKKVTANADATSNFIGVVAHSHKEPTTPYYEKGDAVPVMTLGDIFVKAGNNVSAGDPAGIITSAATGTTAFMIGNATGTSYVNIAGATILKSASAGELTALRLRK